ncbi:Peptide chain release factor 1, mitochondrial [Malassezia sp. CBS 17886]|nr:Peptide chain release factor 1, mitochondrial [Malassezia sp. CBS 17886]
MRADGGRRAGRGVVRTWCARLYTTAPAREPPARDTVAQLGQRMMEERGALLSESSPSAAVSQKIKDLDSVHRAWAEWQNVHASLTTTAQMCESEDEEDMRELARQELDELRTSEARSKDNLRRQLLRMGAGNVGSRGAILELKQGVGGQESCLFAGEMLRMYTKYCECRAQQAADAREASALGAGWTTELLACTPVDVSAGSGSGDAVREAILQVHGDGAFQALQFEAGVHRVQRVPATQNLGKLQTSTIAVLVLPVQGGESEHADDIVDPKDVKIETMRSRGAGGQHVNRTESAVRLTHAPSGINVSMQDSRSQHQNRSKAWEVLRARLFDRKLRQDAAENRAMRRSQVASADRSERVRTYNFPQDRVTDHRVGVSLSGIAALMDGDDGGGAGLTYLIGELQERNEAQQLAALLDRYQDDGNRRQP